MDMDNLSARMVGNDFFVTRPRLQTAAPLVISEPAITLPIFAEPINFDLEAVTNSSDNTKKRFDGFHHTMDFVHTYSVAAFAVLFLAIGSTGTQVAANYYGAKIVSSTPVTHINHNGQPQSGLNMSLPATQLNDKVHALTSQPLIIQMGAHTETIPADTINGWLQIVTDKSTSYVHVKDQAISNSLKDIAVANSKDPKNQIAVTHDGAETVVVAGNNGIKVGDTTAAAKAATMP